MARPRVTAPAAVQLHAGSGVPVCPQWLGESAQQHFAVLVAQIALVPEMLAKTDAQALAMVAAAYEDFRRADDTCRSDGEVITGAHGGLVQHPATLLRERAWKRYMEGIDRFGLNPRARKRMGRPPKAAPRLNNFGKFG